MKSQLKHYKLPKSRAGIFQGEIPEYGFLNMGFHRDDEENATIKIRGLEQALKETLTSLDGLNLGVVEDK